MLCARVVVEQYEWIALATPGTPSFLVQRAWSTYSHVCQFLQGSCREAEHQPWDCAERYPQPQWRRTGPPSNQRCVQALKFNNSTIFSGPALDFSHLVVAWIVNAVAWNFTEIQKKTLYRSAVSLFFVAAVCDSEDVMQGIPLKCHHTLRRPWISPCDAWRATCWR